MAAVPAFDHLAIGVERWRDGFPRFARDLGGRWAHGGDAGEFAPCQLVYAHGMRIELIAPGQAGGGFMRRFLDRSGPGAHHLTFKVPSLDATLAELSQQGLSTFGDRAGTPLWREAFVHPKQAGLGTLLQVAESDEALMAATIGQPPQPPGFPDDQAGQSSIAWIGLTVESVSAARELLAGVLRGQPVADGPGWVRLTWGTGHSLVLRDGTAAPGGTVLWPDGHLGVAHVMFGAPGLDPAALDPAALERGHARARRQPEDPLTGVPVFMVS